MVKKIIIKNGFSLFEALVVMLIVAIFIGIMANVIPHKVSKKVQAESHGRFECYYLKNQNRIVNRIVREGGRGETETISPLSDSKGKYCEFSPEQYVRYIVVNAVGGGAGGSQNDAPIPQGGGAGDFSSSFLSTPVTLYRIYPGAGGAIESDGNDTKIYACASACNGSTFDNEGKLTNAWKEVASASAGTFAATLPEDASKIKSCTAIARNTHTYYNCGITPVCEIVNGVVKVSFCRDSSRYLTRTFQYGDENNWATIRGNKCKKPVASPDGETDVSVFHWWDILYFTDYGKNSPQFNYGRPICPENYDDEPQMPNNVPPALRKDDKWRLWKVGDDNLTINTIPSLFKLEFVIEQPGTTPDNGSESDMTRYIKAVKYTGRIQNANPGNGGKKGTKGNGGAAILSW